MPRINNKQIIESNKEVFESIILNNNMPLKTFLKLFIEEQKVITESLEVLQTDYMELQYAYNKEQEENIKKENIIKQLVEQNIYMKKELNRLLNVTNDEKLDKDFKFGKYRQLTFKF